MTFAFWENLYLVKSNKLLGYLFDKRLLISTDDYNSLLLHKCGATLLPSAGTFDCPKNIRPKITALTVRPEKKMSLPHQPSSIFFQWPGLAKQTSTEVSLRRFSWAVLYSKHQSMKVGRKASIILFLFKKFAKVPFAPWFVAVRGS